MQLGIPQLFHDGGIFPSKLFKKQQKNALFWPPHSVFFGPFLSVLG
jgi:hypothetical protein